MEAYPFTLSEACTFLGISKPTASSWIRSGRLVATRKDPYKSKSPYLTTPQACLAALNNPMHTVAVSAVDAHEEKKHVIIPQR
ncbi:helix-turn-helix domain-containing protein [Serratia symbiotica]|uniref:helix-turn-helix domain-containing protein n=1 Tax=Serratia symbiotica TaxID=138074 RepID=UPI003EBE17F3